MSWRTHWSQKTWRQSRWRKGKTWKATFHQPTPSLIHNPGEYFLSSRKVWQSWMWRWRRATTFWAKWCQSQLQRKSRCQSRFFLLHRNFLFSLSPERSICCWDLWSFRNGDNRLQRHPCLRVIINRTHSEVWSMGPALSTHPFTLCRFYSFLNISFR